MDSTPSHEEIWIWGIFSDLYKMLWQIILQHFILLYTTWRSLMFCNERRSILLMFSISYFQLDLQIYPWSLEVIGQTNLLSRVKWKTILRKSCSWGKWGFKEWLNFNIKQIQVICFRFFLRGVLTFCNCFPILLWRKLCFCSHKYSKVFCHVSLQFTSPSFHPLGNFYLDPVFSSLFSSFYLGSSSLCLETQILLLQTLDKWKRTSPTLCSSLMLQDKA